MVNAGFESVRILVGLSGFTSQFLYLSMGVIVVPSSQDGCKCSVQGLADAQQNFRHSEYY